MVKKIISEKELNWRINRRRDLIDDARPYMKNLYNFVKGSGYLVILTDEEGYILEVIGDDDVIENAEITKLVVGANRSEEKAGPWHKVHSHTLGMVRSRPVLANC